MKPWAKRNYNPPSEEAEEEEAVEEPVEEVVVAEPEEVEELDVYACPVCGKEFDKETSVRMHSIRAHGEYPE